MIGRSNRVTPTPSPPDNKPMINVSALKIDEMFLFDAPIALKIPISLVRSITDIKVMIAIMIDDTTRDIDTKAISTYVTTSTIVLTDDIRIPVISVYLTCLSSLTLSL